MGNTTSLAQTFPGGCYIGFNAIIDRKSAEQLVHIVGDAHKNGFSRINLCISSVGGFLDHTYYAFNILEALPVQLTTWNIGNIQSAANLLFLCGSDRYATDGSTFFFHQTGYDPPTGRITEPYLTEKLKAVQYDDNRSAAIIASKTGKLVSDVRLWQNSELVMDTQTALGHGLIQQVRPLVIPADALFHQILV